MRWLAITIEVDGSRNPQLEVAHVLGNLKRRIEIAPSDLFDAEGGISLYDSKGRKVGVARCTEEV